MPHDIRQGNVYPLVVTITNIYHNSVIPRGLYNSQQTRHGVDESSIINIVSHVNVRYALMF